MTSHFVSSLGNRLTSETAVITLANDETLLHASQTVDTAVTSSISMNMNSSPPSMIGDKKDKNCMMTALSNLNFDLHATVTKVVESASLALLASKEEERQVEERCTVASARRKAAIEKEKAIAAATTPATALMQALSSFAEEVEQSESYSMRLTKVDKSNNSGRDKRKSSIRGRTEEHNKYNRCAKTMRDVKRSQRKERYRHI